jgi:Carboxypeptidase regulatory-like domain
VRIRDFCICMLFGALSAGAGAQIANNTSLVGTVLDSGGAALPGAQVEAIEEGTKVSHTAVTNESGYYSITFINAGTYDITVKQTGFKTQTKVGVPLPNDQAVRTDFNLSVGSTTDTVSVSASTPPLATDDATLGETFSTKMVENLPLNGHNALEVAALSSNVYIGSKSTYTGVPPGEDFEGAGQREIQNSLTLDGVSIMNNLITVSATRPSSDAISEVQMQSGNYPAQYGAYLGIHINLVSKSGSNELHGSAYDYVENTLFNAKPFLATATSKRPILHYNQYGFGVGGPVVIPKIYNGRDKTFFFGFWEKLDQIGQNTTVGSVLTPAMESGDFSALGAYNAGTNTCVPNNGVAICLKDPTTGAYYPGNQIPASEIAGPNGAVAQKLEAYMLAPNVPGTQNGTLNNLNGAFPTDVSITQTLDRIDENIGQHVRLFGRFHWQNLSIVGGTLLPSSSSFGPTNSRNYAFGYTHVISPALVNDFHFGVNKLLSNNLNFWAQNSLKNAGTSLGIPGFNFDTVYNNPGIPVITFGQAAGVSGNYQGLGNAGSNWYQDDRTYDFYDELSYTHGKHNIMGGVEFRRLTLGREASNNPLGDFTFTGGTAGVTSTGYAASDFVLGLAATDQTPIVTIKGSVGQWRDGFFALDNWQASQRLTLNYGLRYDLPTVPYSLNGFARILNPAENALIPPSDATSGSQYKPTPGFKFGGPQHDNWGPRLGLAYRATGDLVLRAGFGAYYNANQLNSYTLATGNYPFAATVNYTTSHANLLSFTNPTPGAGSKSPVAGVPGTYVSAFTDNPNNKTQRSYQWNFDLGYGLWNGAGVDAEYLGSHSIHLDRSFYDNQPLTPGNPQILNSRRPNQLFGDIRKIENDAYSNYNALTVVLRQRTFHGVAGQVSYTWAHDLDLSTDSNGGGTLSQQFNPAADYGNANWDVRNRVVGVITYTLPRFSQSNLLVREAVGGWEVNGLVNVQSGQPFNVNLNYNSAGLSQGTQRPNYVHKPHASCSLNNYIHNTSCVDATAYALPANINAVPGQYAFGNTSRNTLYGPGFSYENVSLFKNFPIWERLTFQFRAEAFNAFNHPSGNNPNVTIGHDSSPVAQPTLSGFGDVTSVYQTPGTLSGARVLSLAGKIIF